MYERIMLISSDPAPGREDEFNEWYTQELIYSILKIDGVRSAQRFKLSDAATPRGERAPHKYFAVYDYVCESEFLVAAIRERQKDGRVRVSTALNYDGVNAFMLDLVDPKASPYDAGTPDLAAVTIRSTDLPAFTPKGDGLTYRRTATQLRPGNPDEGFTLRFDIAAESLVGEPSPGERRYVALTPRVYARDQAHEAVRA